LGFNLQRVYVAVAFFFLILTSFPLVYADRGMISVSTGVSVYEPGQKAILAWNGQEEILILSTDVTSTQETLVLEILPLPSRPEVEAASFQSFTAIQDMIWEEGVNQLTYSTKDNARQGSVEVLFHEQIGAHNITAVAASNGNDLVDWANSFLSASGVNQEITLRNFQTVVEDYMSRGFRHYVLDLITFSPEERSIDPILYRFNSSTLYYPLLITSPVGGDGKITLFTLTKEKLERDYWPLQPAYYRTSVGLPWQQIQFTLSRGDLSKIDLRISELLPDGAWLSVLTFEGSLGLLNRDLMMSEGAFSPATNPAPNTVVNLPYGIIFLCFLFGAVSALAGVAVAFLIGRTSSKNPGTGRN
jgi:hypothetical protein